MFVSTCVSIFNCVHSCFFDSVQNITMITMIVKMAVVYSFFSLSVFFILQLTLLITTVIFVYVFPVVREIDGLSDEVQAASQFLGRFNFNASTVDLVKITVTIYDITRSLGFGLAGNDPTMMILILTSFSRSVLVFVSVSTVILPVGPLFSFLACMLLLLQMMASVR